MHTFEVCTRKIWVRAKAGKKQFMQTLAKHMETSSASGSSADGVSVLTAPLKGFLAYVTIRQHRQSSHAESRSNADGAAHQAWRPLSCYCDKPRAMTVRQRFRQVGK